MLQSTEPQFDLVEDAGDGHPALVMRDIPDARLRTRYLPHELKQDLAWGLDARFLELMRDRRTGYAPGAPDARLDRLKSSAKQAFALGLLSYLPRWAA